VVAYLFAPRIVSLILQGGVFGEESTSLVAGVLQFYALAIVGESVLELVARVFYAKHDSLTPMIVAICVMILRIGLMLWWRNLYGAAGLALAYSVGVCVESATLWFLSHRRFQTS
jgi:putative peptidoglycan lipid II flippase